MDGRVAFGPLQILRPLSEAMSALGSGHARLSHGETARHLWFDDGHVVALRSDRDEEKLGSWLVSQGLVPPETVRTALASKPAGVRLGGLLVGRGLIAAERLRNELEALSLALLWRSVLAGGDLVGEAAVAVPPDARTVHATPRALLIAAARNAEGSEELHKLVAEGKAWVSPEPETSSAHGEGLSDTERYVLSLLKRPRTLDNMRRATLVDSADLLSAVVVLASAGLVIPCKVTAVPPPARRAEGDPSDDLPQPPGSPLKPDWTPLTPPEIGGRQRASIRDVLDAIDAREMADDPLVGAAGDRVVSSADYRRAQALLESACQNLQAGQDRHTVRQVLVRAHTAYPGLKVTLKLVEVELPEAHLRTLALDRLQKALALMPRCTEAWLLLARYWSDRGQEEKTRACAAKILAYDPDNEDARRLAASGLPAR